MSSSSLNKRNIVIVGGGPRGISVTERLCALLTEEKSEAQVIPPLTIHVVDDVAVGTGRLWHTTQSPVLRMNTRADAVTMFTDQDSNVRGPVFEGPSLYEWVRAARGETLEDTDVSGTKTALIASRDLPTNTAEIAEIEPWSSPSRALYGRYLQWVFDAVVDRMPPSVCVRTHTGRAVELTGHGDRDIVTLSDGETIEADATVLAVGWTENLQSISDLLLERSLVRHPSLTWVRSGNPADQAVDKIPENDVALVRGTGTSMFDIMSLVTEGRGGAFVPDPAQRSGLSYSASGREPRLLLTSPRGYPYLPRSIFRGRLAGSRKARFRTELEKLPERPSGGSVDFGEVLWPALLRDAHEAFYRTLVAQNPGYSEEELEECIGAIDTAEDPWNLHLHPVIVSLFSRSEHRFILPDVIDPLASITRDSDGEISDIGALSSAIADSLHRDLTEARLGRDSAINAGLRAITSARKLAQYADQPGVFTPESRGDSYALMRRIGQIAGSGPPAFRTAQLLCLADAGYVQFAGRSSNVYVDPAKDSIVMPTSSVSGDTVEVSTLVDARVPPPNITITNDSLTKSLRRSGRIRPFFFEDPKGQNRGRPSLSPEVEMKSGRLIGVKGETDPRVHMVGIPLHDMRADMTLSPMPHTDATMLRETDAAAYSALTLLASRRRAAEGGD